MKVYVDLDGVLAAFDQEYARLTGLHWYAQHDLTKEEKWALLYPFPDFFLNLPWTPGAKQMWDYLQPFEPSILSAASSHMPQSRGHKFQWCERELGLVGDRVIIVDNGIEKQHYCTPGDVLVDDFDLNIIQWEKKGGIGVRFTDAHKALHELQQITVREQ
jgi:5'(3')-deoxyribonucleotidase